MLEKIKLSMRIFHNALDGYIQSNINACMLDLQRVGVRKDIATPDSQDGLIQKAAELYCKWQDDFNGKGEQYQKAFENLRDAISLCDSHMESRISNV